MVYRIFDAHAHIGRDLFSEMSAEDLVNGMKKWNISKAVVSPMGRAMISNIAQTNDEISSIVKSHGRELIGFAAANPWYGQESVEEIDRAIGSLGLRGIKLSPATQGFPVNHEIVHPVIKAAINHGVPVLIDTGFPVVSLPFQFGDLAKSFPDATLIMGHMGLADYNWFDALVVAKSCPNVIIETSSQDCQISFEQAVKDIGEERLVFGTDVPHTDPVVEIRKIETLDIPSSAMRKIFSENMARLLAL